MLKVLYDAFLNLFFPVKCFSCEQFSYNFLCKSCFNQIIKVKVIDFPVSSPLNSLLSFGKYKGVLERLIKRFKFEGCFELLPVLKDLLIEVVATHQTLSDDSEKIIVPVPLYFEKEKVRGFNQSFLLAKELGKSIKLPVSCCLVRIKNTPPLYALSKKQRSKVIKNSFEVSNSFEIKNKNVFLIDDVFTTGATLKECAKVLKKAGAGKVVGITIARA